MIKSITVTNHLGESLNLELAFPEKSGFAVQDVQGLGPTKADINVIALSTSDGSLFNSARATSRNVVISLKFLENPTIEDSRQLSYKYFPTKKQVALLIETDNRVCKTYGNVESNEPIMFDKDTGTQISIMCPDPYLYSVEKKVTVFSGIESLFEFEFSNDSLTEDLIELGNINDTTLQTIDYSGDSEIGFVVTIHALGPVTNITIYNTETRETMRIDTDKLTELTGSGVIDKDDIIVSTVKGDKYVVLLRDGVYTNILNCLNKDANWFQLNTGENIFAYSAETGVKNLEFRIENEILYEGV